MGKLAPSLTEKGANHFIPFRVQFGNSSWWHQASLVAQMVKNPPAMQETQVRSLGREDPLEWAWKPIPVFWPGESHDQRSLAGYSPWGHKESDTTEHNLFGNDPALQYTVVT